MNIICNNCVGGRLYQQLNVEYNNPFIWCRIYYKSFKKLICNFYTIDFHDIKYDDTYEIDNKRTHIILNNSIELNYTHYIQNSKFDTPTKQNNGIDIYYNDIKSYTINKYLSRLNRMNIKDDNIFILIDAENVHLTIDDINDFLKLKLNGKKILVTHRNEFKDMQSDTVIHITNETNTNNIAKELINNYSNIFNS
jgi:uncharacterized protein (DUF1919 family)